MALNPEWHIEDIKYILLKYRNELKVAEYRISKVNVLSRFHCKTPNTFIEQLKRVNPTSDEDRITFTKLLMESEMEGINVT